MFDMIRAKKKQQTESNHNNHFESIQDKQIVESMPNRKEHITRIEFNNGEALKLESGSIVVLVGPNNAGKSQALRDIYSCLEGGYSGIVVSGLDLEKSQGLLSEKLDAYPTVQKHASDGYIDYYFLGREMTLYSSYDKEFKDEKYFGRFCDFFVANLDTRNRLNICQHAENIDRYDPIKSPIQLVAKNPGLRDWLSNCFRKAFGAGIIPNGLFGRWTSLSIGEPINVEPSSDGLKVLDEVAKKLESYPLVQNQGDGIKSFTGILLYLMLKNYAIYLIDEPEAFLHPPHAKVMGEIIGSSLDKDKQAFIATHSEEIIKGLLETCPDRVKIIRITREQNQNFFHIIDNEQFKTVWNDPLLKYSNIMSSLFYNSVVLCESDSDCKMYSIVLEYLKKQEGKYPETLFIHCGGKQRMASIAKALTTLGIFVRIVPDIDVLNNELEFKNIVESVNLKWDLISKNYKIIKADVESKSAKTKRVETKNKLMEILDSSEDEYLSDKELTRLKKSFVASSPWASIKDSGSSAIPRGNSTEAFKKINEVLRSNGIFIVEVGELECFVKEVGGEHGPQWVNTVLEKYPDIGDPVYTKLREFVSSMGL